MSFKHAMTFFLFVMLFSSLAYGGTEEEIVFSRDHELWIMEATGEGQRFLMKDRMESMSMSLTGKIVFQKNIPYTRGKNFSNGVYSDIYLFDMSDGGTIRLTNDKQSRWPVISPSGTKMVFEKADWIDDIYGCCGKGVWLLNLEDMSVRELVSDMPVQKELSGWDRTWFVDMNFVWSKDEKSISFLRRYDKEASFASFLQNTQDGSIKYVGQFSIEAVYGNKIITAELVGDEFDNTDLYFYDLGSSKRAPLKKILIAHGGRFADFAPTGDKFLFVDRDKDGASDVLWITSHDGKTKKKLFIGDILSKPKWSLDGKKIAFCKDRKTSNDSCQVCTVDVDGSNLKVLTDNATGVWGWVNLQGGIK